MTRGLRLAALALLSSIALGHAVTETTPPSLVTWWLQSTSRTLEGLTASCGLGILLALAVMRLGLAEPAAILRPLRKLTAFLGWVPVLLWCAALLTFSPGLGDLALLLPLGLALGLELSLSSLEQRRRWQRGASGAESGRSQLSWRNAATEVAERANVLCTFVPRALGIQAAVSLLDHAPLNPSWGQQLGLGLRDGFEPRTLLALSGLWLSCWTARQAAQELRQVAGFAACATPSRTPP